MSDVFISYSQRAPEPTHALAAELLQHGIDAWFDVNLLPGDLFAKVIDGEIDRAHAVVTIWSRPALASTWVPAESARALHQGKLLCVRTPDVNPTELPTPFNALHTPLVTDIPGILAGLAARGVQRGNASIGGLGAEHGTTGEAAIAWHSVKDSPDPSEIETFLDYYHASAFYRLLAARKLARLRAQAAQALPPIQVVRREDVFLRIEAGMHTAIIRRVSLRADGRVLATAAHDKTVRLWSLPDGKPLRTLRASIGPGGEGIVHTVALAPDGRWVAVGGWHQSDDHWVDVFDTATGSIVARLGPLPGGVLDVEVSPTGHRLAAGLSLRSGVRVWDTASWREVAADAAYGGDIYGLSFASDGRLAATSDDGTIHLYEPDGPLRKQIRAPGGPQPSGISFSPDGAHLAVGYDSPRVDVLSGETLAYLFSPETSDITWGGLSKVAWLRGGSHLAAAGRFSVGGLHPILVWADGGKGAREILPGPDNAIQDLAPWGEGLAYGAADPAFGLLGVNGERVLFRGSQSADMRHKVREHFLVSADGRRVRFGLKPYSANPVLFDLETQSLEPSPAVPNDLKPADVTAFQVDGWEHTAAPRLKIRGWLGARDAPLPLDQHERARSLAIAPDAQSFVLGAAWSLRRFNRDGRQLWERSLPAAAWGVNLACEGRLIIGAYGDGIIRWHRAADGEQLLALFVHVPQDHQAARRWVLWTPDGYYTASPGGEDLIGWHVNRGPDQAADFYPAAAFRSAFHRPDLVRMALDKV